MVKNSKSSTAQSTRQHSDGPGREQVLPPSIRYAGLLGMFLGTLGLGFGIFLLIRDMQGVKDQAAVISGAGTALWFFIIFGVVTAAGYCLSRGYRWGRGPIAMLAIILFGIAYYMFTSGRPELAVPTLLVGLVECALLFNKDAVNWAAQNYDK